MNVDAEKVISKLMDQIAQNSRIIAILQVQIEVLQADKEVGNE